MFLTDDEIQVLTGHKRRRGQIAWLVERGIPHIVSAVGFPVVALREIERRLIKAEDPRHQGPPAAGSRPLTFRFEGENAVDVDLGGLPLMRSLRDPKRKPTHPGAA